MANDKYIRINSDGTCFMVDVKESPRSITRDVVRLIGSSAPRLLKNVVLDKKSGSNVSIILSGTDLYCMTRLRHLPINCKWRHANGDDSILTPAFSGESGIETYEFKGEWTVPDDMSLIFCAAILQNNSESPMTDNNHNCRLIAFDSTRRSYILPMPNIYNNGDVCMGEFTGVSDSIAGAFGLALDQFLVSHWNTDLATTERCTKAERMFLLKMGSKKMEQIEPDGIWTELCEKISTPISGIIAQVL